jgi:hypothetical protein
MNVFKLRSRLVDEYGSYVRSFIQIRAEGSAEVLLVLDGDAFVLIAYLTSKADRGAPHG